MHVENYPMHCAPLFKRNELSSLHVPSNDHGMGNPKAYNFGGPHNESEKMASDSEPIRSDVRFGSKT